METTKFPQSPSVLHDQKPDLQQSPVYSGSSPAPDPSPGPAGSACPDDTAGPAGLNPVRCGHSSSIRTFPENKEKKKMLRQTEPRLAAPPLHHHRPTELSPPLPKEKPDTCGSAPTPAALHRPGPDRPETAFTGPQ